MVSMTALTTVFDVRRYRKSGMYSTFVLMRALWVLDTREKNQVRTRGVTWGPSIQIHARGVECIHVVHLDV